MARFRKFELGTWGDQRFCELSPQPPSGQALWQYLIIGKRTTIFPGLVVATREVIASDLGWPLERQLNLDGRFGGTFQGTFTGRFRGTFPQSFAECWDEVSAKGMAKADWSAGLIVLPRALIHRNGEPRESAKPGNPNGLKSWARSWPDIPECALKDEYLTQLGQFARSLGRAYARAFDESFGEGSGEPSREPSPKPSGEGSGNLPRKVPSKEQEQDPARNSDPDFFSVSGADGRAEPDRDPLLHSRELWCKKYGADDGEHRLAVDEAKKPAANHDPGTLELYEQLKANGFRFPTKGGAN